MSKEAFARKVHHYKIFKQNQEEIQQQRMMEEFYVEMDMPSIKDKQTIPVEQNEDDTLTNEQDTREEHSLQEDQFMARDNSLEEETVFSSQDKEPDPPPSRRVQKEPVSSSNADIEP